MTDGAYGLRYSTSQIDAGADAADTLSQFLNVAKDGMFGTTLPATCFPNANLSACSWDTDLAYQMGTALASECKAAGVHLLLGPGINLRRTPLAGRAFEYYSEDPILCRRPRRRHDQRSARPRRRRVAEAFRLQQFRD